MSRNLVLLVMKKLRFFSLGGKARCPDGRQTHGWLPGNQEDLHSRQIKLKRNGPEIARIQVKEAGAVRDHAGSGRMRLSKVVEDRCLACVSIKDRRTNTVQLRRDCEDRHRVMSSVRTGQTQLNQFGPKDCRPLGKAHVTPRIRRPRVSF